MLKHLFLFVALVGRFGVDATSCDGDRGTCIDTSASVCSGILKTGYCAGDADVLCCEPAVECDSGNGLCIDTNLQTCDGVLRSGYCAGANNIMCCEQNIVIPDECNGSGPPLPPSAYEFTLENQGIFTRFAYSFHTSNSDGKHRIQRAFWSDCLRPLQLRLQNQKFGMSINATLLECV